MLEDVILVKIRFLNENQIFKSFLNHFEIIEMMFQFIIKIMKILENHVNEMKKPTKCSFIR